MPLLSLFLIVPLYSLQGSFRKVASESQALAKQAGQQLRQRLAEQPKQAGECLRLMQQLGQPTNELLVSWQLSYRGGYCQWYCTLHYLRGHLSYILDEHLALHLLGNGTLSSSVDTPCPTVITEALSVGNLSRIIDEGGTPPGKNFRF